MFEGAKINKVQGGLVRAADVSDRVMLLVCGATAVDDMPLYEPVELNSLSDLESLGITAATDLAAGELTHYHVSEVFRISPERTVHLMLVPKTSTVTVLVAAAEFLTALKTIDGVNTIGMAGLTAGVDASTEIKAAQAFVESLRAEHIYIDVVMLEGLGGYLTTPLTGLVDLRANDSENVAMCFMQDPAQAVKLAGYASHASVGSALGALSVRYVHENIGSVSIENYPRDFKGQETYPLTDTANNLWLSAALSNGTLMSAIPMSTQKSMGAKGYIFAGSFAGYPGVFLSNSPTCTLATSAYAYIEYNAVWNKAAKIIRNVMIPKIRSKVKADPTTGYIASTTISDWDARIRAALEPIQSAGDVEDFEIYIDPAQVAVSELPFLIKVRLVAFGVVNEFEIDLGWTNKI